VKCDARSVLKVSGFLPFKDSLSAFRQGVTSVVLDNRRAHVAVEPVHDRDVVQEPLLHRNVGDCAAPGLLRPRYFQLAQ
jgi:hypothetical protein